MIYHPMGRYHNGKRLLNRRRPDAPESVGTRKITRAADPAKVRLRCENPRCGIRVFLAAEPMRCPGCQHPPIVVGAVQV